jgi:hypothetical protein
MTKLILALFALGAAASTFAQGRVAFTIRIPAGLTSGQTTHIWGPSTTAPGLSLIGLGSNDSPSGTTPFGSASGMALIGAGGSGGKYGSSTTFAQLIGAVGSNQPESTLVPVGLPETFFSSGSRLGNVVLNPDAGILGSLGDPWQDAPYGSFEIVAWDNSSGLYPTWTEAFPAWTADIIAAGHSAEFTVSQIGGFLNPPPYLNDMQRITSFNIYFIPEPSTVALAGLGAIALLTFRRRK